ncbi:hypothetical protein HYFRA_00012454 [Hymenoscyphus fraxineus]|uniref:PHD and RING finger domain-containing protein n=1 Tax=Hymenoscyphus fraxineus TaxID=746836 RepID=A0A9N9PN44_9HELO|nr:hypothetical protein HYFRA_00012454 [Hymenoscyphus fraxineus]
MHPDLADQSNVGRDSSMDMVPDNSIHDLQAAAPIAAGTTKSPTTYPESPPTSSDSMVDQCIVCLEDLCITFESIIEQQEQDPAATSATKPDKQQLIAVIKPCGHSLHDECLREWTQKANSCPFCRQSFNLVEVLDKVGGNVLSEYTVENKKQVASTEFDPAWIEEPIEEEEGPPCPICNLADNEDVLLLCNACDAPYHTYCVGLSGVPRGDWYCMECHDDGTEARALELGNLQPHRHAPRTQGAARRNRRRIREDHWYGAWSIFSSRVHDVAGLDLDFSDGEDDGDMGDYRQLQRRRSGQAREFQQWQQRLHIATRHGARETFQAAPRPRRPTRPRTPPTPEETKEEARAWGDFERAKEMDGVPRTRKRKSRSAATSATASPVERPSEPERKLKRPRTRRVLVEGEASSSSSVMTQPPRPSISNAHPTSPTLPVSEGPGPSFLTSLLKEVEMSVNSDDDTSRSAFSGTTISAGTNRVTSPSLEYSSPAASPAPSTSHTPRALSITPPPHLAKRQASPRPLTSHVEPSYPRADYSPNRSPGEPTREIANPSSPTTELRQPRPRRQKPRPLALQRSPETSPVRETMSAEAKDSINKIVKNALKPIWQAAEITKEQYAGVNRDVSRKLYEMVADRDISENREKWEKVATAEVATAVKALKG